MNEASMDVNIGGFLDETLDEAAAAALLAAVRQDSQVLRNLVNILSVETLLDSLGRKDDLSTRIMQSLRMAASSPDAGAFSARIIKRIHEEQASDQAAKRRWSWFRAAGWMALAASLLVIAGGIVVFRVMHGATASTGRYAMGRVSRAIGQVAVADQSLPQGVMTRLQTATNSVCRIDQPDGTIIAMAETSRAEWIQDKTSGAKTLTVQEGQTYMNVSAQKQPFTLRLPSGAQAQVMGTQLYASRRHQIEFFRVIKGNVRLQFEKSILNLSSGQAASPVPSSRGGSFFFTAELPSAEMIAWLDRVGLNSRLVLQDAGQESQASYLATALDFSRAAVRQGTWRLLARNGRFTATQEDPDADGTLIFGNYAWLKGEFSCKVRVSQLSRRKDLSKIYLVFAGQNGDTDSFGPGKSLPGLLAYSPVINLQADFEVRPTDGTVVVHKMHAWPEGNLAAGWIINNWTRPPGTSGLNKRNGPCALGVRATACAAEFSDIRLENFVSADPFLGRSLRFSAGMIAAYDFRAGQGANVEDSSKVSPAINLSIGKPACVKWAAGGLRVTDAADIALRGDLSKIRDAWQKNSGISVELFVRPAASAGTGNPIRKLMCLSVGDESISWTYDGGVPGYPEDRLYHYIVVFNDRDARCSQTVYKDGEPQGLSDTGQAALTLHTKPGPLQFTIAPTGNISAASQHPWQGDLIYVGIYDHPLQPSDVVKLFYLGVPPLPTQLFPKTISVSGGNRPASKQPGQ